MKTAEQHFIDELPADIAVLAICETERQGYNLQLEYISATAAIGASFSWHESEQGVTFWRQVQQSIEERDFCDMPIAGELDELRKDKARLDWMLNATADELNSLSGWRRQAIDAAMEACK